ncbi:hypothetical protein ACLB2K_070952 [Fragaria x ananassa]
MHRRCVRPPHDFTLASVHSAFGVFDGGKGSSLFKRMPRKDVAAWSALIAGECYSDCQAVGFAKEKSESDLRELLTWLRIGPTVAGDDQPDYDLMNAESDGDQRRSISIGEKA